MSEVALISSLTADKLGSYVLNQVSRIFPDPEIGHLQMSQVKSAVPLAMERVAYCHRHICLDPYRSVDGTPLFNHLHGDQYGMFLYFLSNTLYQSGEDTSMCARIFALNKMLHGIDAFYEVNLPQIFLWVHPLGTVLGRASYNDYFVVYQRCGVGSNHGKYPAFGQHVTMHPGSSVLGNCQVGKGCELGAETLLLDHDCPDNHLVVGLPSSQRFIARNTPNPVWG